MNSFIAKAVLCAVLITVSGVSMAERSRPIDGAPDLKSPPPIDLVDERPGFLGSIWMYSTQAVGGVWGFLSKDVFSWVTPPTPGSLTQSVSKQDAVKLFKLLGDAGYKLKEINTDLGIIPSLSFKFGQSRELSEADYDYMENLQEEWRRSDPGMYASIQRKILDTITTVNMSGEYRVSSLVVKLLPLPDVAFTMSPKQGALSEEGGALMRAIQRIDRHVLDITPGHRE